MNSDANNNPMQEKTVDLNFRKSLKNLEKQIKQKEEEFNTKAELRKHVRYKLDRSDKASKRLEKKSLPVVSTIKEKEILARWIPLLEKKNDNLTLQLQQLDREILKILENVEDLRDQYEQITIYARNYYLNMDNNNKFKNFLQKAS
jgi:septal ring factor EnvC (AmiA/AmiB activator)